MRVQNWVIEVGVVVLMVGTAVGIAACSGNENRDRTVGNIDYELKADGCVVKAIDNPRGPNFFIAKCPAASETTTYQHQQGKVTKPLATVVTSEDLRKQLAEIEAKEKALAKLTIQEKVLLGIKE
jgi:hypothetical protein